LEVLSIVLRVRFRVGDVLMERERRARVEHEVGSSVYVLSAADRFDYQRVEPGESEACATDAVRSTGSCSRPLHDLP